MRWTALLLCLLCPPVWAASLAWNWTQGDGGAADGFKIHYGATSGAYTNTVDVGNVFTWPLPDAWPSGTYYFAATAYNHCCDPQPCTPVLCESSYSNEAVWVKLGTPSIQPASGGSYRLTWIEDQPMAYVLEEQYASSIDDGNNINRDVNEYWHSITFTPSKSYTVTKVAFNLRKVGSPNYEITLYIYSSSGNNPSSLLATTTTSFNVSSLTTSFAKYDFLFSGLALSSGTKYCMVWQGPASYNYSNYWEVSADASGPSDYSSYSANGTTWGGDAWENVQYTFDTYSTSGDASAVPVIMRQYRTRR